MNMDKTKCLVIGSGPAGYTAAIYASRANLSPILVEGMQPGGQLTQTTVIENFPGFPHGITGPELMENMRQQAINVGTDIRSGSVVAVVGGGDTACEEANYLASLAAKVYLIVRKPFLRASKAMQDRTLANPKIEVLFEHNTEGLFGEDGVEGVHLVSRKGEADEKHYDLAIDGFFLAIGHKPNSDVFKKYLKTDETGYFVSADSSGVKTVVPGVFVAGDVADPHYRQAINAAASGCRAAMEAERYLSHK